jgi:hypothetical protein
MANISGYSNTAQAQTALAGDVVTGPFPLGLIQLNQDSKSSLTIVCPTVENSLTTITSVVFQLSLQSDFSTVEKQNLVTKGNDFFEGDEAIFGGFGGLESGTTYYLRAYVVFA